MSDAVKEKSAKAVKGKGAKPAEAGKKTRAARLEQLTKASTLTVVLEPGVRKLAAGMAKQSGLDMNHFIQKLVEDKLIEEGEAGNPLVERLRAKRAVISRVVDLAREMDAGGKFDENFILEVVKAASKDKDFAAQYAVATGADTEGKAPAKFARALNQQIGRVIKRAVGAKSKRNDAGRIARAQVTGEVISTYTLLERAA
ncbi:MAG: hypothetical protein ACRBBV_01380 [Paracoccaceae bacterium]